MASLTSSSVRTAGRSTSSASNPAYSCHDATYENYIWIGPGVKFVLQSSGMPKGANSLKRRLCGRQGGAAGHGAGKQEEQVTAQDAEGRPLCCVPSGAPHPPSLLPLLQVW